MVAAIDDLIAQIEDRALRERLKIETDRIAKEKKFGLVFEEHLPELTPLYNAEIHVGSRVARRGGDLSELWRVLSISAGQAVCVKYMGGEKSGFPIHEIMAVANFGEPIFPTLIPVDKVQNGPNDAPWHTLIEADNYHALQLLEYLYTGQIDCIYIDPPYNTGARDWKYNNDYVDANDSWRHSKWLAFMQRRLRIARRLLKDDGVLITTVDDNEFAHLWMMLRELFPSFEHVPVTIQHNPGGTQGDRFSVTHEYAVFSMVGSANIFRKPHVEGDTYNLRRWGSTSGRFDTLLEAAEFSATRCTSWSFATSNDRYNVKGLLVLAETSDSEDPIDEDSFYVVSPAGAIGLCNDGEDIDWLFLSDAAPNEDLPLSYQDVPQMKFCSNCGSGVVLGARFCGQCGTVL